MKRHPLYRQIRCHLASTCAEDAWLEEDLHFVVFQLHASCGGLAYAGFAVDRRNQTVLNARLLVRGSDGLWTKPLESLPHCARAHVAHESTMNLPLMALGMPPRSAPHHNHQDTGAHRHTMRTDV